MNRVAVSLSVTLAVLAAVDPSAAQPLTPPSDVSSGRLSTYLVESNMVYGMFNGLALLMDVYHPTKKNGQAVLYINGCGWHSTPDYNSISIKDYADTESLLRPLVERGFTVFSINHRTAPRFRYPAAIEDARRAARFIRHHRNRFGVTSTNLAGMGGSSGGHLVLTLALRPVAGSAEAEDPVEKEAASLQTVVAWAAPSVLVDHDNPRYTTEIISSFIGEPRTMGNGGATHKEASPITYVDPSDPPVLLIHGTDDEMVPVFHSRKLRQALINAGVQVEYWEIEGATHDLRGHMMQPGSEVTMKRIASWLVDTLITQPSSDR